MVVKNEVKTMCVEKEAKCESETSLSCSPIFVLFNPLVKLHSPSFFYEL